MKFAGFGTCLLGLVSAGIWVGQLLAQAPAATPSAPTPGFATNPPLPPPIKLAPRPVPRPVNPNRPGSLGAVSPGASQNPNINFPKPIPGISIPSGGVGAGTTTPTKIDPTALAWDAKQKEIQVKSGETEAKFVFAFTNVSSSAVTLQRVQTSCGCTAARLPKEPWVVEPGERGDISVVMDVRGKSGRITKTATVFTSVGNVLLQVNSVMGAMGDRTKNLQIAAADRQAPLRGECATCHVTPALGQTGKVLFDSACGICHTAEHRASFVPDLARLNKPTDLNYWTSWITYGREGSLMPAFHQSKGGFLSDDQIHSLAAYMETEFKLEAELKAGQSKPATLFPGPLAPPPAPAK
jgi:mono/diheme cytochrome c family protein